MSENLDNEQKNLFFEAIEKLKKEKTIKKADYQMYFFQLIESLGFKGNKYQIKVNSEFSRDYINNNYKELIEKTMFSSNKHSLEVIVDSKLKQNNKQNKIKKDNKNDIENSTLNKDYKFDNFIVGTSNNFAFYASQSISKNPGGHSNPFLIYGGVGLGKTHLLHSIGNEIEKNFKDKKIKYVRSSVLYEDILNFVRNASKNNDPKPFYYEYKNYDVLLIDDIHTFQKKDFTQEEIFKLYNYMFDNKKQIVLTCDRPISELKDFQERLKSRFGSGLNVDISPPDYETRLVILQNKLKIFNKSMKLNVKIKDEVLELIANNINTNIRDLEGSLKTIMMYSDLIKEEITYEMAKEKLKDMFTKEANNKIDVNLIIRETANYFNISIADIKGKTRNKNVVIPRQMAMYIATELTELSTTELGNEFDRNHSTIISSRDKIISRIKVEPNLEKSYNKIVNKIKEEIVNN